MHEAFCREVGLPPGMSSEAKQRQLFIEHLRSRPRTSVIGRHPSRGDLGRCQLCCLATQRMIRAPCSVRVLRSDLGDRPLRLLLEQEVGRAHPTVPRGRSRVRRCERARWRRRRRRCGGFRCGWRWHWHWSRPREGSVDWLEGGKARCVLRSRVRSWRVPDRCVRREIASRGGRGRPNGGLCVMSAGYGSRQQITLRGEDRGRRS